LEEAFNSIQAPWHLVPVDNLHSGVTTRQ